MVKDRTTILYLVNGFGIGGAEKALLELVKRIDKKKYRVLVATVGQSGPLEKEFTKYSEACYIFKKKFSFDTSLIKKIAKILINEKVDILQTTLFYADAIGIFAAKIAKTPIVLSWQTALAISTGNLSDDKFRHMITYRLVSNMADHIVAVSHQVRRFFIQHRRVPPNKISTIHYGVDLCKFQQYGNSVRHELAIPNEDQIIVVVGHLSEVKGHIYLIEAVKPLMSKYSNLRVLFVGDGPKREILKSEIKNSGLSKNFNFLGVRSDIPNILHSSNIFVLPSIFEGLPNVILEAMASSLPVVASRTGGIPEAVVSGKTGFLFTPRKPSELRNYLDKLLSSPPLQMAMGREGRARAEKYFSIESEVNSFDNLYQKLFDGKKA